MQNRVFPVAYTRARYSDPLWVFASRVCSSCCLDVDRQHHLERHLKHIVFVPHLFAAALALRCLLHLLRRRRVVMCTSSGRFTATTAVCKPQAWCLTLTAPRLTSQPDMRKPRRFLFLLIAVPRPILRNWEPR